MGGMPNYGSLIAFRFILGCIESGFFPGVLFLLSCWYKPAELGQRFSIFYSAAVLSGAFGGLLAGGITSGLAHAPQGIAPWRWLFIIEGSATVGISLFAYFILLDFPATSKSLSLEERQLATVRILAAGVESNNSSDPAHRLTHWQAFKAAMVDYRTFLFMVLFVLDVGAGTVSHDATFRRKLISNKSSDFVLHPNNHQDPRIQDYYSSVYDHPRLRGCYSLPEYCRILCRQTQGA